MAENFVLVRILNMRGVDLNVFDFDYDLTWAAFFLNAEEKIYGRYGSRDADSADKHLSLAGLRYAMLDALAAHRREPEVCRDRMQAVGPAASISDTPILSLSPSPSLVDGLLHRLCLAWHGGREGERVGEGVRLPASPGESGHYQRPPPRTVEQYPAAQQLKANACIHCHQVYDFRRKELQANGKWQREDVWVYPLPENVGLTMGVDQGNRLDAVRANSPADRAGLQAGDVLHSLNGRSVASLADVQYALHRAPAEGRIRVLWQRDGHEASADLSLPEGWRKTDVSWRPSLRGVGPPPCVHGEDLTAEEKRSLGLAEKYLAFRQGNFIPEAARQAGIRQNDIILGIDYKTLEMSARQFSAYIRLTYQVGDRVTFNLLRNGQRLNVPLKLPSPAPY